MAGCTVGGGFGLRGPCMVESPLYLRLWDEHRCALALIETINNGDSKKKEKKGKKVTVVRQASDHLFSPPCISQHQVALIMIPTPTPFIFTFGLHVPNPIPVHGLSPPSGHRPPRSNDPTIDSYNNYHLSPIGIPSGNQRWYGLVHK